MTKGKKHRSNLKTRTPPKSARSGEQIKPTILNTTKKNKPINPKNHPVQQKLTFNVPNDSTDVNDTPPTVTPKPKETNDIHSVTSSNSDLTDTPVFPSQKVDETPTTANPEPVNRTTLRYRVTISVNKSNKPTEAFSKNFQQVFGIMQAIAGTNLWLLPWDEEQENDQFPVVKQPSDLPDGSDYNDRFTLAIYTGSYLNLKPEGSKVWTQLRLMHIAPLKLDISQLGHALQHAFTDLSFEVRFGRQPLHCQATKTACLGWLYGSSKTISEDTFLPAVRAALKIPDTIAIGMQWRAISDKFGKKPAFDQEKPPPSALHIDIDSRHAPTYQRAASNLWRHYDKQRDRPKLPNDIQLRLVPCFSSPQCRSLSATATANIILMSTKQHFFVTERLTRLEVPFILLLDTPLSDTNSITLRRAIMSRSPKDDPTKRLIHNIDFGWQDSHRVYATTVKPLLSEAYDFIASLIPEMVHRYGHGCQKWFSAEGLTTFESVTWDPEKMITTSAADHETQNLVDEDLWGLGTDWRTDSTKKDLFAASESSDQDNQVTTRNLEDADDVQSFASTFGNKRRPSTNHTTDTRHTKKEVK